MIAGCAVSPHSLGISEDKWKTYDKAKQESLLRSYVDLSKEREMADKNAKERYAELDLARSSYLQIKISSGQAVLPPFTGWQRFKPVNFLIVPDTCNNTYLVPLSLQKEVKESTLLRACYRGNILTLDPSLYDPRKKDGTIRFVYSPLWNQGFTYSGISTHGTARLRNVNVEITSHKVTALPKL